MAANPLERLVDRAGPRRLAEAITRPSGVLLAGAATAAAIVGGVPIAAAAAIGAACWVGRVVLALPRKRDDAEIDPFRLSEPWRGFVRAAQHAARRFEEAVDDTDEGPLRNRLAELRDRIAVGVRECWRVACKGDALDHAVTRLDVPAIERELSQVERELETEGDRPDLSATADSVRRQLEAARRLQSVAERTRDRLRRIDAQLDEAVARAIELSLHAETLEDLVPLGSDVEALVEELESLHLALDQVGGGAPGSAVA
jgi:hypothetical protein